MFSQHSYDLENAFKVSMLEFRQNLYDEDTCKVEEFLKDHDINKPDALLGCKRHGFYQSEERGRAGTRSHWWNYWTPYGEVGLIF